MSKSSCTSEFLIEMNIVQVTHFHLKLFQKFLQFFCCPNQIVRYLPKQLLMGKTAVKVGYSECVGTPIAK
jgi:5,10-methylene-tetrahydrofolate dehydrogenase/methenyl tetrahydrofolate cyclohydrolase